QIGTSGIPEADTTRPLRGIRGQLDELDAGDVVALDELARREIAREEEHSPRRAAAAHEALHTVTDEIDRRAHRQRIDEAGCRQHDECSRIAPLVQRDNGDVVRVESLEAWSASDAPIGVRVKRTLRKIFSNAERRTGLV